MIVKLTPSPDLAGRIDFFWTAPAAPKGGRIFTTLLPEGGVNLVLRIGSSGCRLACIGPSDSARLAEFETGWSYYGVRFLSGQAPRLLQADQTELAGTLADLSALGGLSLQSLGERLVESPGQARLLLEDCLRALPPMVEDRRVRRGAALIEAAGGMLSAGQTAASLGIGLRTLERLFLRHLGVTPKRLIRLVRLRRAAQAFRARPAMPLADLSVACGYYDQSHFLHDFKSFLGTTPRTFDPSVSSAQAGNTPDHRVLRVRP